MFSGKGNNAQPKDEVQIYFVAGLKTSCLLVCLIITMKCYINRMKNFDICIYKEAEEPQWQLACLKLK